MLRFLTAGESHGQALVVIVEGRPPACRSRSRRCRPNSLGGASATGGARACGSSRTRSPCWRASVTAAPSGRRSPSRSATPSDSESGSRRCRRRPVPRQAADPAPPGPRRPGRNAEVRLRRRPRRARAGQRRETAARPRGRCAKALLAASAPADPVPRRADGPVESKAGPALRPADLPTVDESPVRCFDHDAEEAMIAEIEGRGQGGRLARGASSRCWPTACPSASAATCTGTASSTASSPRRS